MGAVLVCMIDGQEISLLRSVYSGSGPSAPALYRAAQKELTKLPELEDLVRNEFTDYFERVEEHERPVCRRERVNPDRGRIVWMRLEVELLELNMTWFGPRLDWLEIRILSPHSESGRAILEYYVQAVTQKVAA